MGFGSFLKKLLPVAAIAVPFIGQGLAAAGAGIAAAASTAGSTALAGAGISAAALGITNAAAAGGLLGGAASLFGTISSATSALGGFGNIMKTGGTLLNAFGTLHAGQAQAGAFQAQANIAALNQAQIKALLPLQLEALDKQIESTKEAADIRTEDIVEKSGRAKRTRAFVLESINRQDEFSGLTRDAIVQRASLNEDLVASSITQIETQSAERNRQIRLQREHRVSALLQKASKGGIRVRSGSTAAVGEALEQEADFAIAATVSDRDAQIADIRTRADADQVTITEQLGKTALEVASLGQQRRENEQALEDAAFDAAMELRINERNRDIAIERAEHEKVLAQKRADAEIAQQQIIKGQADAASDDAQMAANIELFGAIPSAFL